jgi:hypothetical protein
MLPEIVRCPYCVQGGCFRPMLQRSEYSFVCLGCGHTTIPDDPQAKCSCVRCYEVNQAANRCRNFEELRRYAGQGTSIRAMERDEVWRY